MDKVREISSNNYALLCNGKWQSGFYKIEKVAEKSHYYCLWPTPNHFYLYHIDKDRYAINSNTTSDANKFSKIEHYSEETGSFVAYREDEDFAHIIFEDGYVESTTFSLVGEETEGIRVVKTCSERWFFYDTRKRKNLHLTGSKGYTLNGSLDKILTYNIFVINNDRKGKRLVLYNRGKAPIYSRDYFDSIEAANKSTFIGKLYNRNIYCIVKANNIAYPIGYYTSLPQYVKEHNLFIAPKGESYCIVKGEKEIQNHQWKTDSFIFQSDYVLNKQKDTSYWKIFNANDGHEVPTNFKDIQVLNESELYLSVEDNGIPNKKVSIEDIERISQDYIHSLLKERTIKEEVTKVDEKAIIQSEITSNNIKKKMPSIINYYIFVPLATIIDNRLISGSINCEMFRGATYVVWFVLEKHRLIVTESRRTKVHNILFTKEDSPLVEKLYKGKHFWKYRQVYPIDCTLNHLNVDVLEEELSQHFAKMQLSGIENERKPISEQPIKKQEQPKEPKVENHTLVEQETTTKYSGYAKFRFDQTSYQLKLDEVWDIDDIFQRKRVQYRQAEDTIAILYDFTTDYAINSPDGHVHYHLYGEGKDKRFGQYFGQNSNTLLRSAINSETKRILLFKRDAKKKLLLQDEVKCVGYYRTVEEDSKRSVIYFKLESTLRYPFIKETTLNESEKKQTIIETKGITNKEEINKPSNHTDMSKLQELYETRERLLNLGIAPNADLEKQLAVLEEESIQNEIVPIITQTIYPILKPVKRKVILVVDYDPEDGVHVHLSQKKTVHESTPIKKPINLMEKNIEAIGTYKKLKVTFPDGTIICENKVVETLALTIQKFGTEKVAELCEHHIDPCLKPSGIYLVSKKISPKYEKAQHHIENGWLVFSCTNTLQKKRQIEVIANALDIKVRIDII